MARPLTPLSLYPSAGWFVPKFIKTKMDSLPLKTKKIDCLQIGFFPQAMSELSMCTNFTIVGGFFLKNQDPSPNTGKT